MSHVVVLYDGECGLCARVVQFTLARDKHDRFRYAALQSGYARAILERHGRATDKFDTFLVVHHAGEPNEVLEERSRAGLDVLQALGGLWSLAVVLRIVPRFLADAVYNFVATHRFQWFGRVDYCLLPAAGTRQKFLDSAG